MVATGWTCKLCGVEIDGRPARKPSQSTTRHCDCPQSAWVLPGKGADPRKLTFLDVDEVESKDSLPGVRGVGHSITEEGAAERRGPGSPARPDGGSEAL